MAYPASQLASDQDWLGRLQEPQASLDIVRCLYLRAPATWSMTPRRHRDHVCYLVLDGQIDARIDGDRYRWPAGSCHWIGPGVHHHAVPCRRPLRFIVLRLGITCDGKTLAAPQPYRHLEVGLALRPALDQVAAAWQEAGPLQALRRRAALLGFFAAFAETHALQRQAGGGLSVDERRRLSQLVRQHGARGLEPADCARLLDRSPSSLRRACRRSFGCSPRSWLHRQRLLLARELLAEESIGITAIAERCGYASPASFSRLFKQAFGCSPLAWRKRTQAPTNRDYPRFRS